MEKQIVSQFYMNHAETKAISLFNLWIENPKIVEQNLGKARLIIDEYKKFEWHPHYKQELPTLLETFLFKKYDAGEIK